VRLESSSAHDRSRRPPAPGEADQTTERRRRRVGRFLLLASVLLPAVLVVLEITTRTVWNRPLWPGLFWRGAHTEIVVLNISGHDVQIDLIRFADHADHFKEPLEARRESDPDQNIVHYQEIYFRDIVSHTFPVEIRYVELDTGVERHAYFVADRRPRSECAFVVFIKPDGPELSDCQRSDMEDFRSP
jgi:hypothetical protein